jgi:hypothetical protein
MMIKSNILQQRFLWRVAMFHLLHTIWRLRQYAVDRMMEFRTTDVYFVLISLESNYLICLNVNIDSIFVNTKCMNKFK